MTAGDEPAGGPLLVLVTGVPATGKSTVAEAAADQLAAPLLAHDWAMSALRPYPEIQRALDEIRPSGHRIVGWSLLGALARAQLRRNRSVVLDGVARTEQVAELRALADQEGGCLVIVETTCREADLHRSRVDGRDRGIPDWYELDWDHVRRVREQWEPVEEADLVLDAGETREVNLARLRELLDARLSL